MTNKQIKENIKSIEYEELFKGLLDISRGDFDRSTINSIRFNTKHSLSKYSLYISHCYDVNIKLVTIVEPYNSGPEYNPILQPSLSLTLYNRNKVGMNNGFLLMQEDLKLSDEECMFLYNYNITIQYLHNGSIEWYDKKVIMRRYTINNIIT